ncbi:phenylacetate--CoA ligase family protein [Mitsuokella sp. oral taxon 131]|uniref:phenylacetate--CoA ligase family protein n=1 Tax=Mitsuokella sp. oral taxon 131 TaxID=1321780 RepID=UPI0003AD869B|nr:phenylacetate--CoA ligase family protein [Mitsuokella sp. oral taxon 131]ERL25273.1 hypothetical protein HMPREF1985_00332 [Mitsuokella sp. oral taxon 131 str. W9106]
MYANPEMEQCAKTRLKELQLERLKRQLRWAQEKSVFYRERFARANVSYEAVETLSDLRKIPFLERDALWQENRLDFLTIPFSGLLRYGVMHEASREFAAFYTNGDIAHNVEMMTRALVAAGVHRASVVALFGDLADSRLLDIHYALEVLGATVIPMGTDYRQWLSRMDQVRADTFVAPRPLLMRLIIHLQAAGMDIAEYACARVLCLNTDAIQNPMQHHIEGRTKIPVYNLYAPMELGMAGLLYACETRAGQHIQEDYFYPEIIAFGRDAPVTDKNQMGELVVTSLAAEAMPLIRYRTGQAVSLADEPCRCGRTLRCIRTPFAAG